MESLYSQKQIMVLIPILLVFLTGLLILRLCNQHKFLNIFEQLVLGFVSALSLFVLELFLGGIIFDKLSLLGPILTFVILLSMFIYKITQSSSYREEILESIKDSFLDIKKQFKSLKSWKKYIVIVIGIYVLVKLIMVFQINTNMPTFDEDAVAGRDIKTKIFTENKSLILDKTSPEYFGTDYGRYPFAGLVDTYFLLPYGGFVNGMSNIISPLIYLLCTILLFGIFLRKTNFLIAAVSGYIFTSLPFVFIHGFGSYRNFPSGVFLFVFVFYLIDQIFNLEKDSGNKKIIFPIILVGLLSSIIRNEGVMLTGITTLAVIIIYHIVKKQDFTKNINKLIILMPIIFAYILNKIIYTFYPTGTVLNSGGAELSLNLFSSFSKNISQSGVFSAPFQQMFLHPDYILLFPLFIISLVLFFTRYKKSRELRLILPVTILLLCMFMFTLYANVQSLGLITHYAFIRYPVSIVLFIIYIIAYSIYINQKNNEYGL